jgi:CHAD domain-containing protein
MAYRFAVGTVDVSQMNPAALSIHLLALLEKLSARAGVEDVHHLRTTVRRLEVELGEPPAAGPDKKRDKIARSLQSLRRQAGKVRDLDVHLGLLAPPLLPTHPHDRSQDKLRRILQDKRARNLGKLHARIAKSAPLLESRLPARIEQAPHAESSAPNAIQQTARARQQFLQRTTEIPADVQPLHQLRIQTRKLRYALEPLQACQEVQAEAAALVAQFKQVQDAIGVWHDWATLEQLAARHLNPAHSGPLCHALHARCQREYRRARRIVQSVRHRITQASATAAPGAGGRRGVNRRLPGAKPSVDPYPARAQSTLQLILKAG